MTAPTTTSRDTGVPEIRHSLQVVPSSVKPGEYAWRVNRHTRIPGQPWSTSVVRSGREPVETLAYRVAAAHRTQFSRSGLDLVTTREAADLLYVSVKTIRSWETRGYLTRVSNDPVRWYIGRLLDAEMLTRETGQIRRPRYT